MPHEHEHTAEEWCPVVGWEGSYEVSSKGRVRSLDRLVNGRWGSERRPSRILRPTVLRPCGRPRVSLCRNGVVQNRRICALVLEAFIGPRPPGMEACHHDGNPANNRAENLRWDTHNNNMADRDRHGRLRRGEAHGRAILTNSDVLAIRAALMEGRRQACVAVEFGVCRATISHIARRRRWVHLK